MTETIEMKGRYQYNNEPIVVCPPLTDDAIPLAI
jgi:hypothetical protein